MMIASFLEKSEPSTKGVLSCLPLTVVALPTSRQRLSPVAREIRQKDQVIALMWRTSGLHRAVNHPRRGALHGAAYSIAQTCIQTRYEGPLHRQRRAYARGAIDLGGQVGAAKQPVQLLTYHTRHKTPATTTAAAG
ncbi:hypothetical protein BDV10DRAFT_45110 [Aspergillus recurvatus]